MHEPEEEITPCLQYRMTDTRNNFRGIGFTSNRTRERMVERLREQGVGNEQVLEAMRSIPRHAFVDEALATRAYEDTALPIGFKQTISQPYIVARMAELMLAHCDNQKIEKPKVLEIGTGCGYQAAVLDALSDKVYSIERIEGLYKKARTTLQSLRLSVYLRYGDGFEGLPRYAPFDAILMAAAPEEIPEKLLQQLNEAGILLAPEGAKEQYLVKITKHDGELHKEVIEPAKFVPFLRGTD